MCNHGIGEAGITALCQAGESRGCFRSLKTLWLDDIVISDACARSLTRALSRPGAFPRLRDVDYCGLGLSEAAQAALGEIVDARRRGSMPLRETQGPE